MPVRKAEILDIAVALADERGLAAVSMRAIAERAGVTPMALYPYIGSKAALLDAMLGHLLGQLTPAGDEVPRDEAARGEAGGGEAATGDAGRDEAGSEAGTASQAGARRYTGKGGDGKGSVSAGGTDRDRGAADSVGWRERMGALARAGRAVVTAHPWAAELVFARPAVTADSARTVDLLYTTLLEAGVPPAEVPRLERMLSTVVIGFAASEAGGRFGSADDARGYRGLRGEALPGHARLAATLDARVDWDAEFEADLDDLALLIEAVARRGASGPLAQP